jgi:hypothetical protein
VSLFLDSLFASIAIPFYKRKWMIPAGNRPGGLGNQSIWGNRRRSPHSAAVAECLKEGQARAYLIRELRTAGERLERQSREKIQRSNRRCQVQNAFTKRLYCAPINAFTERIYGWSFFPAQMVGRFLPAFFPLQCLVFHSPAELRNRVPDNPPGL